MRMIFLTACCAFTMALGACKTGAEAPQNDRATSARGENPIWELSLTEAGIVFSLFGQAEQRFPYVVPVESGQRTVYVTKADRDGKAQWLRVSLTKGSCRTSSIGKKYAYQVEVDLDGQLYLGCGE